MSDTRPRTARRRPAVLVLVYMIIWVALQAAGAVAWMPAVRRLGSDHTRRPGRLG